MSIVNGVITGNNVSTTVPDGAGDFNVMVSGVHQLKRRCNRKIKFAISQTFMYFLKHSSFARIRR
jgi:hypothetical protein